MLDNFEGGVDWSQSPWKAQYPLWNINSSTNPSEQNESSVVETMNPEWHQYGGDFNGGPDFGYIYHDLTVGAKGTSKSLKYTVTGGNKNAAQPPNTYGGYLAGSLYFQGLPKAGETVTINGTIFTFQVDPPTGTGQVQIGSTTYEAAKNLASAINGIAIPKLHAYASQANGLTTVSISRDGTAALSVSETSASISWYGTSVPQGIRGILTNYADLLTSELGAGNFYLYFGSAGGAFTTGLHDRFVVPSSKRPPGSNRMTVWIKSPSFGSLPDAPATERINIGTRVNSQERFDAGFHAGSHYYHQMDLPKSDYWTKVVISNNPDHIVSGGGYAYTPDDPSNSLYCPDGYCFHYMESLSHFYIEGIGKHSTPLPFNVWIDEVEVWQENRVEDTEYIASRTATYLGGDQFCLTWTGRWGAPPNEPLPAIQSDPYKIYWSNVPLNETNLATSSQLIDKIFNRPAYGKIAKAVFTIPNFDVAKNYYFAIQHVGSDRAAFIDYEGNAHTGKVLSRPEGLTAISRPN